MNDSREWAGARTLRLARKELREVLRDRRTIITLVLMPLLVYPLLGVIMRKGLLSGLDSPGGATVHLCVESEGDARIVTRVLQEADVVLTESTAPPPKQPLDEAGAVANLLSANAANKTTFVVEWPEQQPDGEAVRFQVEEGFCDLGILLRPVSGGDGTLPDIGGHSLQPLEWQLLRRSQSKISEVAFAEVAERLEAINRRYAQELLRQNGLSVTVPAQVTLTELQSRGTGGYSLITFIPLVLVLMTMTGAVYPAIDLTAGERERGTLEILVAAPVSRMTLLGGKFLAVLVVALLTASVNLISMFATLFSLGLEEAVIGSAGWKVIPLIALMMVVFAAFFSAVLLSLTSVARSFKEAQAYLIPLMLVSLTPGVFSLMPNLKMNMLLAVTPLANTVLLGRDLLQGYFNPLMFAVVLISTSVYGLVALSLAARIFGSDSVLYGSGGSWAELFRRPEHPQAVAPGAVAWTALAIVFSLFLTVNSLPARLDAPTSVRFLAGAAVGVGIFVLVPLLLNYMARVSPATGFALTTPSLPMLVVAALLGISLWPFVYEIDLLIFSSEYIERLKELASRMGVDLETVPLAVKLLCFAVMPALTEEFFFRGFLQNSLRTRFNAAAAIAISAVSFGAFHVIVRDALFLERFIPTMLMGLVLGIVFERSRSVFPGMLLHLLHNGLLMVISHFKDSLMNAGIGTEEQQHLPLTWLAGAAVPIIAAAIILWSQPRHETPRISADFRTIR